MKLLLRHPWQFAAAVTAVYWLALFAATHAPGVPIKAARLYDKAAHFGVFAGLALLLAWTWALWRRQQGARLSPRALLGLLACIAAYAAADELLQIPIPRRHGSLADWIADVAGAALGLLLFVALRGFAVKLRIWPRTTSAGNAESGA